MTINEQIANGSGMIILSENTKENVVIPADTSIIFDLAGFRLENDTTDDANEYTITNHGTLTVMDSVGTGEVYNAGTKMKGCIVNLKGGIVNINGGKWWTDAPRTTGAWYYIVNMGVLMTINYADVPGVAPNASTIRNGFYTDEEKQENYVEGQYPKLVINDGVFTGQLIPVKNDEGGDLEINGGTFEGPSEAVLNWNIGKITGGTFKAPEDKFCIFSGAYTNDMSEGKLDVTGGTFIGGKGIRDLTPQYAPEKADTAYNYITGGKWEVTDKTTVTEFIKPGYEAEFDEDGNLIVKAEKEWTFPEGGIAGMGFMSLRRLVIHNDSVEYTTGGFELPVRGFLPLCIVGCMAKNGCDAYYNKETKKIQLFRSGVELNERIYDVTIVMVGN